MASGAAGDVSDLLGQMQAKEQSRYTTSRAAVADRSAESDAKAALKARADALAAKRLGTKMHRQLQC